MAFRIGDLVLEGGFYHSSPYGVHGHFILRGCETPFRYELTGFPESDLCGRSLEFSVPANDRPPTDEDRRLAACLALQQVGPTGLMTAARRVKTFSCSVAEFNRLSAQGTPPPVTLSQCLYLEWFSQNGRMLIEIPDPEMRFLEGESAAKPFPLPNYDRGASSNGILSHLELPPPEQAAEGDSIAAPEALREVEQQFNEAAERVDRALGGDAASGDSTMDELMAFDERFENGEREPVSGILHDLQLPAPTPQLSEVDAGAALSLALGRLALHGIAFHVCHHCSLRDAYRILVEHVSPGTTIPGLASLSFVQHFTTSDYCEICRAE